MTSWIVLLAMIDVISQHLTTIRTISLLGYGLFYLMISMWIISRGIREPWVFSRRRSRTGVVVPGRIVLGIFFLFSAFREFDIGYSRSHHRGDRIGFDRSVTDWDSTIPAVIGFMFVVWSAIRFIRNDVGCQGKESTS